MGSKQNCYRLCRVSIVFPDAHDNVRACQVKFRPCQIADIGKEHASKTPEEMRVGVQRFFILLPVELQVGIKSSTTQQMRTCNKDPIREVRWSRTME